MSKIGYNIKKIRGTKGLSQQGFADLFDISRGNISSYEELRAEPKLETIIKIAKYFSIGLEELLTKELSINDILNFNHQKIASLSDSNQKKLAKVPYLNNENLQLYLSQKLNIEDLPIIEFPIYNAHKFIALENNNDISEHIEFELPEHSVLFFEEILIDNLHTLDNQFGMFFNSDEIFIGKYHIQENNIELILNHWKKKTFSIDTISSFWKYYGKFEKAQKNQ